MRLLTIAALGLLAFLGAPPDAPPIEAPPSLGQWVWTSADIGLLDAPPPGWQPLTPAVFVGTIDFEAPRIVARKGLDPGTLQADTVVIRIDDRVRIDEVPFAEVDVAFAELLAEVDATGHRPQTIQLDFDVPRSQLARWARWLHRWSRGRLRDREVWITSIPDHLRHPRYGELFSGAIRGHVLQVFDTGIACDDVTEARLRRALAQHRLPFAVGVGAFERPGTQHRGWFHRWRGLAAVEGFSGLWVFPAGHPYRHLLGGGTA